MPYPIQKGTGFTEAERYLQRLCSSSFLSLWSYPSVFRDQGDGNGKEVCDLLVVFGDDVLIFADKQCAFSRSANLQLDWSRWFKRAVLGNVRQLFGAERWIRDFPNRLFLDPACKQRFPVQIPARESARFHRIVVAHGVKERCREELGSGSGLLIIPGIAGDEHYKDSGKGIRPFAVGTIDSSSRVVHVLDDQALETTMRTLDTVSDFVTYLRRKEEFIASGALASAASEQELLAYYLLNVNDHHEHYFEVPPRTSLTLIEGLWDQLCADPRWRAEIERNRVSYFWDEVIERFSVHVLAGTEYFTSGFEGAETVLHFMAREGRARRRYLSLSLGDFLKQTKHTTYAARVVLPQNAERLYYVFVHASRPDGVTEGEYRIARLNMLKAYCAVTKFMNQDAQYVVGIATCADSRQDCSEDAIALDCREWSEEQNAEAKRFQSEIGLLTQTRQTRMAEEELFRKVLPIAEQVKGNQRNLPCPCGSGRKYKKCHGLN